MKNPDRLSVYDGHTLAYSYDDWDEIISLLEGHTRALQWQSDQTNCRANPVAEAVDAKHYKGYYKEAQWLEVMCSIPTLRDPEKMFAALELQVRKYLDRNGQKDNTLQELKKAQFYLAFWVKYKETGEVPSAEAIHTALSKI